MTKMMQKALDEILKLPEGEQDAVAEWILESLSDRAWEQTFSESEDLLAQLADNALKEHRAGKTVPLNADEL